MDCTFTQLSYGETGYFSNLVSAYTNGDPYLKQFYRHPPTVEGIAASIQDRKSFAVNRQMLADELQSLYNTLPPAPAVSKNIELLRSDNTFTVCTAHQPAIFTGNLFFIYKIVHAIKLAESLKQKFPAYNFVPVFYMGCEDADLDELGHIFLDGEKIAWQTSQKGAVGRMSTKGLDQIINRIEGELSVQPFGPELVSLLKASYLTGSPDIQTATLRLVHQLFAAYGLVVLIPDNAAFKKVMIPVFEDELLRHRSAAVVENTISELSNQHKVQAQPRQINLFYLNDNLRQRIERTGDHWTIVDTDITFTEAALLDELHTHPERFSPNVILRGLFQETLLPNVAFIGGGGEIAYWLELKGVFDLYKVPYPPLVVRNSFLVMDQKWKDRLDKLGLSLADVFRDERELLNGLVKRNSQKQLSLSEEITDFNSYYNRLKEVAGQVDDTLTGHVAALQTRAIKPLQELEKKLLRAERKRFDIESRQLHALKTALFPNGGLQERVDNFMPYYAKWGKAFIKNIHTHSLTLEQKFTILNCE